MSDTGASPRTGWQARVPQDQGRIVRTGVVAVFGTLVLFMAWAAFAPLASAVIAPGRIVVAGQNKLVQHPQGGVVRRIHVDEGATVRAGDVIVTLDATGDQAELSRLAARRARLEAERERLETEREGGLAGLRLRGVEAAPAGDRLRDEQARVRDAASERRRAELDAAASRVEALRDRRLGVRGRIAATERLVDFTEEEIARMRPLVAEGYLAKSRLREMRKEKLERIEKLQDLRAQADAMGQEIVEAEAELARIEASSREERGGALTKIVGELAEIEDALVAAKVSLDGTQLRAPVDGVVKGLTAWTVGGVAPAGQAIAEIVPAGDALEAEFRVPPHEIESVGVGQNARVQVSAFDFRTVEPVPATVSHVAADSTRDEATGEVYFLARARLRAPSPLAARLRAGMAGDVFVDGRRRVFLSYLTEPVTRSFARAFRQD